VKQAELPLAAKRPRALTVSEAVRAAGRALEARFAEIWVEGELSNAKRHTSGHLYFSLKDAACQLACVMFRTEAGRLKFAPQDGLKVRCRGKLSVFDQQGRFQMYVEAMEPAGLGAAQLALEQLKQKLAAEGLFEQARKRTLPRTPRTIGVVTSSTGAAVRDILRVLHRRAAVRVLVAPALVQGPTAPGSILRALHLLREYGHAEVVILGRGGGSAEDLAAFNHEQVVRAVAGFPVPVISAVGHEIDVTLCDFAADLRAPTPSAAAELAVPVDADLRDGLRALELRLGRSARRNLDAGRIALERLSRRLEPRKVALVRRQILDDLTGRLRALHPQTRLARDRAALSELRARLVHAMRARAQRNRAALQAGMAKLDALSPLRVLDRGYAIATRTDGHVLRDPTEVAPGDAIDLRLARGPLACIVKSGSGRPGGTS
jgi:exodeoxyribonuclease VII large subunit